MEIGTLTAIPPMAKWQIDSIDMYPDVFVGRASVENDAEAQAFVNKVLTYEKNPPNGHELDMLFLGEVLWHNPYTNSGLGKDHIDSLYVPPPFDPITKLYEALGNENHTTVMNALNAGQNIVNHDGHAWYSVMGIGNGSLSRSDMGQLTNGPKYSILFSIGCWPAAFDYDCIAERFVNNPNGGGVAFIGNSRYGWGSPGNPLYGYSDRFDQQFFKKMFVQEVNSIGNALAMAKAVYVPFSGQENVYRWCEYEINLLGDPEMPVWTDMPKPMIVSCPLELPVGDTQCEITITDGNIPIDNARVCLMQDTTVYETGFTVQNGQITFSFQNTDPSTDIHLTVTAPNFIPYETTISVLSQDPYIKISDYSTNGSGSGYIIPGELISMDICVKNFGNQPSNNVTTFLRNDNSEITLIDSIEAIGTIQAGDSVIVSNAFSFQASSNIINGEVIYLNSEISDGAGKNWDGLLSMTGATPILEYCQNTISDSLNGDGDGFAEPGETVKMNLIIKNDGLLLAENVTVSLSSSTSDLIVSNPTLNFANVLPASLKSRFAEIQIDPGCPTPAFPQLNIFFQTQDGYQFADSFLISIGEMGIWDDMENGENNWTHSGATDLWHLSSNRKISGNNSWYCGTEGSFVYQNYMENKLESIPVIIGQEPELSFWCWYDFPNYGTDGFYVEVSNGSNWETLDFIGSGGALLNTGNDWLEYNYDLSHYPPGSSLALRFRFVSDDVDVAEGVYIDDVKIHEHEVPILVTADPPLQNLVRDFRLHQNYPNPFNPNTTISYQLPCESEVELSIFNILGQKIKTLVNGKRTTDTYKVVWDGTNEIGQTVASGIYLYKLSAKSKNRRFVETKKMLLLR
jgi:hypothetical protein